MKHFQLDLVILPRDDFMSDFHFTPCFGIIMLLIIVECFEEDERISMILTGDTNSTIFNPLKFYLPLFAFLAGIPRQERQEMRAFLANRTYEKLKDSIDRRIRDRTHFNVSGWENFEDEDLVLGYHNATIYNAIRAVWINQLRPFLPLIDQIAIMQYFSQRKDAESERESLWTRIWQRFNKWMRSNGASQRVFDNQCWAVRPLCIRAAVEALDEEERVRVDRAAEENRFNDVANLIRDKLADDTDLNNWLYENRPPAAIHAILEERPVSEEEALQRLRDNGVISSLKHYYKSVIESRPTSDQTDLRRFFDSMNITFARCFDPLREQFLE